MGNRYDLQTLMVFIGMLEKRERMMNTTSKSSLVTSVHLSIYTSSTLLPFPTTSKHSLKYSIIVAFKTAGGCDGPLRVPKEPEDQSSLLARQSVAVIIPTIHSSHHLMNSDYNSPM